MDKKTVLLMVDDDETILLSMRAQLKSVFGNSLTYELATFAKEALEIVEETISVGSEIILVISDWLMPGMKGDEFVKIVKERYPDINIIMVSGQIDKSVSDELLSNKIVDAILPKPWRKEDIIDRVKNYCRGCIDEGA